MKLKKGDKVKIIKGKDNGKEGAIARVWLDIAKVTIDGVNLYKRHIKPRGEGQKGEIRTIPRPLPVANVQLICPKCKLATRVGYELDGKEKNRICKKCKQTI